MKILFFNFNSFCFAHCTDQFSFDRCNLVVISLTCLQTLLVCNRSCILSGSSYFFVTAVLLGRTIYNNFCTFYFLPAQFCVLRSGCCFLDLRSFCKFHCYSCTGFAYNLAVFGNCHCVVRSTFDCFFIFYGRFACCGCTNLGCFALYYTVYIVRCCIFYCFYRYIYNNTCFGNFCFCCFYLRCIQSNCRSLCLLQGCLCISKCQCQAFQGCFICICRSIFQCLVSCIKYFPACFFIIFLSCIYNRRCVFQCVGCVPEHLLHHSDL